MIVIFSGQIGAGKSTISKKILDKLKVNLHSQIIRINEYPGDYEQGLKLLEEFGSIISSENSTKDEQKKACYNFESKILDFYIGTISAIKYLKEKSYVICDRCVADCYPFILGFAKKYDFDITNLINRCEEYSKIFFKNNKDIVYIDLDIDEKTSLERIKKRGRKGEHYTKEELVYFEEKRKSYYDHICKYNDVKKLKIDAKKSVDDIVDEIYIKLTNIINSNK